MFKDLSVKMSEIQDSVELIDKRIKNTMAEKSDLDIVKDKLIKLMDKSKNKKE